MQQRQGADMRPPIWPNQPQGYPQQAAAPYAPSYAAPVAPHAPAPVMAPPPQPRRRSILGDMMRGAFLGDFARDLGIAGAVVQIIFGFTPGIGDICAVRDMTADALRRDWVGLGLNILALVPIAGGFPKTIEVIRTLSHLGHVGHIAHRRAQERDAYYHPHP